MNDPQVITDEFLRTILQYEYLKNRNGRLRDARMNISQMFLSRGISDEVRPPVPLPALLIGSRDNTPGGTPPPSPPPMDNDDADSAAGFQASDFDHDNQLLSDDGSSERLPGRRNEHSSSTESGSVESHQTGSSFAANEENLEALAELQGTDYPVKGLVRSLLVFERFAEDKYKNTPDSEIMAISWRTMRWWFDRFAQNQVPDDPVKRSLRWRSRLTNVGTAYAAPRYTKLTENAEVEFDYNKLKITIKKLAIRFEWEHSRADNKQFVEYWPDTYQWIGDDVRLWEGKSHIRMAEREFQTMVRFLARSEIVLEQLDFDLEPYSKWTPMLKALPSEYLNHFTLLVHRYMLRNPEYWLNTREFYTTLYRDYAANHQPFDLRWLRTEHLMKIGYRTWNDSHDDEERDDYPRSWQNFHLAQVGTDAWIKADTLSLDRFYRDVLLETASKFTSLHYTDIMQHVVKHIIEEKVANRDENPTTIYLPHEVNLNDYALLFGPRLQESLQYRRTIRRMPIGNTIRSLVKVVDFQTPRQILVYIEIEPENVPRFDEFLCSAFSDKMKTF